MKKSKSVTLSYLFWNFLKIGSTAFGGSIALVSVIENIIVGKRKLLTHEDMLDGIFLASVLPGPVAANVVAYVGYRLRGGVGALITATAILLPSFFLVNTVFTNREQYISKMANEKLDRSLYKLFEIIVEYK